MDLESGQKTPLSAINSGNQVLVEVEYGAADLDIVLFGLNDQKKIDDDRYTILFSNLRSPNGEVEMQLFPQRANIRIDLGRMPKNVTRLMLVASHDTMPLFQARPLVVKVGSSRYDAGAVVSNEKAIMLSEIYLHNGDWRLAAVGQGFSDGLAKLVEHLGGSVSNDASNPSSAPIPAASDQSSQKSSINLTKITLEKSKSVSLEKRDGQDFGDIILNLNWAQGQKKAGFFGSSKSLDLDLGCLFEMENGQMGVVQALGNAFGRYHDLPFIQLDGDDRSGSNTSGETIRINGKKFGQIKRIAVFALIYDGAVRWSDTDAKASIKIPGQPEVVVEIRDGNDRQRLYGMAIIENENGSMKITNHSRCYLDQREFANDIGIIMRWSVGSKD